MTYQSAPQPYPPVVRVLPAKNKSTGVAYLLWFFLGLIGGHKFYLGKAGMGILYLFTLGLFLVGWFIDMFTLPSQVNKVNHRGY